MFNFRIFVAFSSLFSLFQALSQPEFPIELEIQPNIFTASSQSIALLEDGRFIAVWSVQNSASNDSKILGQSYDHLGNKLGSIFAISSNVSLHQENPSIAAQKDGSFVVVWEGEDGDGLGVYCQIFDSFAQKTVEEFQVNKITKGDQFSPSVSLENSIFTIVWVGPDTSGYGIYCQLYDFDGGKHSDLEFRVNRYTKNDQISPSVDLIFAIMNSTDAFVYFAVEWMSLGQDGSNYGIYGRFISFSFQTQQFAVSKELKANSFIAKNQTFPHIKLSLVDHNFILTPFFIIEMMVVWQSEGQDGFGFGVYGQHFQVNVTSFEQQFTINKIDEEFQVNTFLYGDQTHPSVAFTKNNGFIVVWQSQNQDGDGLGIFAQEFDLNESRKIGVENQINVFEKGNQKCPCISSTVNGLYIIAWISASMSENGISLHANLYKSDRSQISLKAQGSEINITDESIPIATHPSLAVFSITGYFVTVWSDNYTYGQILNSQNQKVGVSFMINMTETLNAVVAVVGENGSFVVVWEAFSEGKKKGRTKSQNVHTQCLH